MEPPPGGPAAQNDTPGPDPNNGANTPATPFWAPGAPSTTDGPVTQQHQAHSAAASATATPLGLGGVGGLPGRPTPAASRPAAAAAAQPASTPTGPTAQPSSTLPMNQSSASGAAANAPPAPAGTAQPAPPSGLAKGLPARRTPSSSKATATAVAAAPAQQQQQLAADGLAAAPAAAGSSAGAAAATAGAPRSSAAPVLAPRAAPGASSAAAGQPLLQPAAGASTSSAPSPAATPAARSGPAAAPPSAGSGGSAAAAASPGALRRPVAGLPSLPPRTAPKPAAVQDGPVLDPDEPEPVAEVRRVVHRVRTNMVHAALRLGYDPENALVKQVLYRLNLAEKLKAPWRRAGKRPDPVAAAVREAQRLEREQPGSGLGFTVKIMLIGMMGSGKTQLARALLSGGSSGGTDSQVVHPFDGATRAPCVLRGAANGIGLEIIDTPGLCLAAAGAKDNCRVLQQIRRAYQRHRPDLLVYVERLDDRRPGALAAGGSGGQLAVLRSLSSTLEGMWLNTIIAFTHAGSPPPSGASASPAGSGPGAVLSTFERWLEVRSHSVQSVIRKASGDERLMNPVAFAESHPACPTNAAGQPVIFNGMPWRAHFLLMVTSAKLLADTEAMLQMNGGAGPGGPGGAMAGGPGAGGPGGAMGDRLLRQMLGVRAQVPMAYIMQQVVQQSRPLKFPDHRNVMDLRRARHDVGRLKMNDRQRREACRQIRLRAMGLRQANRKARSVAEAYRNGTVAGCKLTPEPPRVATRCRPSALPSQGHRYRVPEASGGWIVRPNVESHCADSSDGVEGLVLNKMAVAGPDPSDGGLNGRGVPYHHYLSAQVMKDQCLVVARSEATLYHDLRGHATSSVSAELQTSTSAGAAAAGVASPGSDLLAVLRTDTRLKGPKGSWRPKLTVGSVLARMGEGGRLHSGPTALGLRLQAAQKAHLFGSPAKLQGVAAIMQPASELAAGRLGPGGEACLGGSLELMADLGEALDLLRGLPVALGVNALRTPDGELASGVSCTAQYRLGHKQMVGVRASYQGRGRAGLSAKLRSVSGWWLGLVAMALPLGKLALDTAHERLLRWRAQRRQERLVRQQREQAQRKQLAAGAGKGGGPDAAPAAPAPAAGAAARPKGK